MYEKLQMAQMYVKLKISNGLQAKIFSVPLNISYQTAKGLSILKKSLQEDLGRGLRKR